MAIRDIMPARPIPAYADPQPVTDGAVPAGGGAYRAITGFYGNDGPFRLRLDTMVARREPPDAWLRVYNIGGEDLGGVYATGTRDWGRKGSGWQRRSNRRLKLALHKAHLRPPMKICDFDWGRVL